MDVIALFRSLRRFIGRFDVVLFETGARPTSKPLVTAAEGPHMAPRPASAGVASQSQPASETIVACVTAEAPALVPAVAPPKKMRTLEEVRADLARLRLSARERHAQVHAWRDTNFAPTDFMELAN